MSTSKGSSQRTRVTTATLFINGNFAQARRLLPQLLLRLSVRIHLVVSQAADAARFTNCTGLQPARVLRVTPKDGFPSSFHEHRHAWQQLRAGDVAIRVSHDVHSYAISYAYILDPPCHACIPRTADR